MSVTSRRRGRARRVGAGMVVGGFLGVAALVATQPPPPAVLELLAPPTATTTVRAADVAAARVALPRLRVAPDVLVGPGSGYDRTARFGRWPSRGAGCDLRDVVLAAELERVEYRPGSRCNVAGGVLAGRHVTSGEVDVDHVVPLRLAWSSGAAGWSDLRRRELASDPRNLRAELASSNRSDGDVGPEASDPGGDRCRYGVDYALVAEEYGLTVTPARLAALEALVDRCGR